MKGRKLAQLIFTLALGTLTYLGLGAPPADASTCETFCYRQWGRCVDQGRPIEECDDRYLSCLNAC